MTFTKIRLNNPCHNELNGYITKIFNLLFGSINKTQVKKQFKWKQLLIEKHEFATCIKIAAKNIKHGGFKK